MRRKVKIFMYYDMRVIEQRINLFAEKCHIVSVSITQDNIGQYIAAVTYENV